MNILEGLLETHEIKPQTTELEKIIPHSHLKNIEMGKIENLSINEQISKIGQDIYQKEVCKAPGVQAAWKKIAKTGDETEFSKGYSEYVCEGPRMKEEQPEAYRFFKDRIFLGKEYKEVFESEKKDKLSDDHEKNVFAEFGWDPKAFRLRIEQLREMKATKELVDEKKLFENIKRIFTANCYAFAMKLPENPLTGKPFEKKLQPGDFACHFSDAQHPLLTETLYNDKPKMIKKKITDLMKADAEVLGLNIKEVKKDYKLKDGEWMIALVCTDRDIEKRTQAMEGADLQTWMKYTYYGRVLADFHFYRRGENGVWYHKPGPGEVSKTNFANETIKDPETCNRRLYEHFLGYYVLGKKEVSNE